MTTEADLMRYYDAMMDDYDEKPIVDKRRCQDCDILKVVVQSFPVCPECGTMDIDNPVYYMEVDTPYKRKSTYKRRLYCMEKLKLMSRQKKSNSPMYDKMIVALKRRKFSNLQELRTLMNKHGFNKFYKYIFNIYYDIKGVDLIRMDYHLMENISRQFVEYDTFFRQKREEHQRKNMLSYTSIIHHIMTTMRIKDRNHLLLPHNHESTINTLKQIICEQPHVQGQA